MTSLLERPHSLLSASHWTVLRDGAAAVGGVVASTALAQRFLGRAESLVDGDEVVDALGIDDDAPHALGALVLGDPIGFDADEARLQPDSAKRLGWAADLLWQFDEVLVTAEGIGDRPVFEADAIELSRQRVQALVAYLEFCGVGAVEVRVTERARGLVDARGAAQLRPAERRVELRLRRVANRR